MRMLTLMGVLFLLGLGTSLAADKPTADSKALEGTWEYVAPDGEESVPISLEFAEGKLTIHLNASAKVAAKLKLTPDTTPGLMDLELEPNGETLEGIYTLKDNELRICFSEPNKKERPGAFPDKMTPANRAGLFRKVP